MADLAAGAVDPAEVCCGSGEGAGSSPRRIGVFGGTFDPPHVGHLVTAVRAAEQLALDVVLLVVANVPWQKVGTRPISPAADRVSMVEAAVEGEPTLVMCDLEVRRGGDSFTVDTLELLRLEGPEDELVLILGADTANVLDTWKRFAHLPSLCRLAVVDRPGTTVSLPAGFTAEHLRVPQLEVSSTEIRRRVAESRSIRYLVPERVVSLIEQRRLYRGGHDDDR